MKEKLKTCVAGILLITEGSRFFIAALFVNFLIRHDWKALTAFLVFCALDVTFLLVPKQKEKEVETTDDKRLKDIESKVNAIAFRQGLKV